MRQKLQEETRQPTGSTAEPHAAPPNLEQLKAARKIDAESRLKKSLQRENRNVRLLKFSAVITIVAAILILGTGVTLFATLPTGAAAREIKATYQFLLSLPALPIAIVLSLLLFPYLLEKKDQAEAEVRKIKEELQPTTSPPDDA